MLHKIIVILKLNFLIFLTTTLSAQIDNDKDVFQTWLEIIEYVHSTHTDDDPVIYTVIAEEFFKKYRETDHLAYLNFALHEAGRSLRQEMFERLNDNEKERASLIIDKLIHRQVTSSLFEIRQYSPNDLYLFLLLDLPDEFTDKARKLLDHWHKELPLLHETDVIKASFLLHTLIIGYHKLRDFRKVSELGDLIIEDSIIPPSLFTLDIYEMMIYPLFIRGEYSKLLNLFESFLLPNAKFLVSENRYGRIKMDYASTKFQIGKIDDALQVYLSIIKDLEIDENVSYYGNLLNNIALSYLLTGNSEDYIDYQLRSYNLSIELNNHEAQIETLRNLILHHQVHNEISLAYDYLEQAIEIASANNLQNILTVLLIDKAVFTRDIERKYENAIDIFYEALPILKSNEDYFSLRQLYLYLATTYEALNNKELTEKYFLEGIKLITDRDDPAGLLFMNINYAEWLLKEYRLDEAISLMVEYDNYDINGLPFNTRVQFRNVQAKLLMYQNRLPSALALVNDTFTDILDWMLQSSDQQTGHMQISSVLAETIRLNTLMNQMHDDYKQALISSGKLRNISRTGFYNNPALKSSLLSEDELIQDYNLGVRIQQLRNMYADANEQQRNRIRAELTQSMSERNLLINRAFPRYVESEYGDLLRNPRRILNRGEMVIYFAKYKNQLFQFFVTRSGVEMISYPDDRNYYSFIDDAIASFGYRSTDLKLMHQIYETFFEGNIPADITHIYIVPDGDLYRIPFEIMPVKPVDSPDSYGSARYFIEEYSVSYLNTLSDLTKEQRGSNGYFTYDFAGFGISNFSEAGHGQLADLPFSPIEVVHSINNLTSLNNNQMYIGELSNQTNFKNTVGNTRIIHIATHSQVTDNNPLFSTFYMYSEDSEQITEADYSEPNANNGKVRAYEIFDLNMDADLVFLSSCESGSGGYLQGTGILGFSRAFSYAGAKSLVLNVWPVRDQTSAELTPQFYDYLNQGLNKAEAIQRAKINYMNQRDSDPYLWGTFVVYGNTDPIVDQSNLMVQLLLAFLSLIGIYLLVSLLRTVLKY